MTNELTKLCEIMTTLRAPNGCGWDRKQTLASLKKHLIEETYETIDAIDALSVSPSDRANEEHCEELGDLLFQIVFQCEIQRENGAFDIYDVCRTLSEKLIRRHPHIFSDAQHDDTDDNPYWEQVKKRERAHKGSSHQSILDGLPKSQPQLNRAMRLGERAAEAGFDWEDRHGAFAKMKEEFFELEEVINGDDKNRIVHELGDIMLACTNLARHLKIDAEDILKTANNRFERRFRQMESDIESEGTKVSALSQDILEDFWQRVKHAERN